MFQRSSLSSVVRLYFTLDSYFKFSILQLAQVSCCFNLRLFIDDNLLIDMVHNYVTLPRYPNTKYILQKGSIYVENSHKQKPRYLDYRVID